MNTFKFYSLIGIFSLLMVGQCLANTPQLNIICVINFKLKGDADQIKGVERALLARAQAQKLKVKHSEVESSSLSSIDSLFQSGTKNIIISSNDYGVEALKKLRENKKPFYGVLTTHQCFDALKAAIKKGNESGIDLVALPAHAVTPEVEKEMKAKGITLVETIGVAQNLLSAECDKSYASNGADIKGAGDPSTKYLLVLLGGDTQNADGTWSYYKINAVKSLAKFIADKAKQDHLIVLVTNGPRTGKFNSKGEETSAHRNGVIDSISLKFIETLKEEQLPENQIQLFDFQFGQPSNFSRLVGAIRAHPGSQAFIDGASTSVVSQALANFSGKALVVLHQHPAMSDVHHRHNNQEYNAGRVALLKQDMTFLPIKNASGSSIEAAEDKIAASILAGVGGIQKNKAGKLITY